MTVPDSQPLPVTTDPEELDRRRWRALHEWAAARTADRADWDETALKGVMHGCKNAGVTYEEAETVLLRIARTPDDHRDFAELKDLARNARHKTESRPATEEFREVLAAIKAKHSGPLPRLTEVNDTRETA